MSQPYKSGRQRNLNLGISSITENQTVLQTTGKVGIGTTNAQNHSLFVVGTTNITGDINVGGASTFVGVGTFGNNLYVANQLYVAGVNVSGGATIGQDITTRNITASGISTLPTIISNNATITNINSSGISTLGVTSTTNLTAENLNVTGIGTIKTFVVPSGGEFDVYDNTAVFHNNVRIDGSLSIGGTSTIITAQDLRIYDKDIVLGITSDAFGNDISNDTTSNHGGIAIASTEGSPLVDLALVGFSTLPATYKQIMWVAKNSYGVGTTDAWHFNYAVGIGSTLIPNGVRFAVKGIQFTDTTISAPNLNLSSNLNVVGVATILNGPLFVGSGTRTGTLNQNLQVTGGGYISSYVGIGFTNPFSDLAIYNSSGSWISLVDPGASSAAFENNEGTLYIRAEQGSGNSEIVFQTGTSNYEQKPSVSGSDRVVIDKFGNLLINQQITSGVSNQRLQVSGGAYVSGYMGVGTSNPTTNLYVQGNEYVTGVVTATRFYGDFVGTGISITGITTVGIISATDLNVSGIVTVGSLYVGPTQVLTNDRELQNITSATLGITSLSQLFVTGVSTFVGVTTNRSTIFGNQLSVSGVSTFNGLVDVNSGLTANSVTVENLTNNRIVLAGVGGTLRDDPNLTFNGQVFNVTGLSTFAGITTVSGDTLFTKQLSVSGVSTFVGFATFSDNVFIKKQLFVSGGVDADTTIGQDIVTRNLKVSGISTFVGFVTSNSTLFANQLSVSGVTTHYNDVHINTNNNLYFGNNNDMRMFHDGGAAYITNNIGILFHRAGQHFFENAAGTETLASFVGDGAVSLYYDNAKKFETVGTGVTVTGTVYAQNFSTGNSGFGININNNTITGPSSITIDPAGVGDDTGAVRIKGDLYVDGTQFIVNSQTIELADFNVGIATTVGTNLLLDGAGIGIGSTNIRKTLTYSFSSDALKTSENFDLASGKVYKIGGTEVLSSAQLTVPNISATGVSTLGITSATSLTAQQLNVSGITTLASLGGITTTGGDLYVGRDLYINNDLLLDELTARNINVTGLTTVGVVSATSVNATGIITASSFRPSSGFYQSANGTNAFFVYNGTGNVAFQGTIGASSINNGQGYQAINFTTNSTPTVLIPNDLNVTGLTTLASAGGITTTGGDLYVGRDLYIKNDLFLDEFTARNSVVTGISTLGIVSSSTLYVSGVSTFVGFSTFQNNVSIGGTLDVNGNINFNGNLFQNNAPFIASRWTATSTGGNIYRLSNVGIGTSTLLGAFTVSGDANISGVLTARQFVGGVQAGVATLGITTTETLDVFTSSKLRGQIKDAFDNAGTSLYVLTSGGPSGNWSWQPVTVTGAGTLNGISVREEGGTVGTALSITVLDFKGNNIIATADPQPNGIATITVSDTPTFNSINVTGFSTFAGITTVSGDTLFTKQLSVSGVATIATLRTGSFTNIGTSLLQGNVQIDGDLTSNGNVTLGDSTSDVITITGRSAFGTDAVFSNNVLVSGIATANTFVGNINSGVATITTLVGTNATFSGNVSIGGTLTYEDVTNVDSIGIITARSDVRVGGNLSVVGVTTLASAGGITTTGGDLYVGDDIFFKGNLYQNGQLFAAGIGIGSTSTNPSSGLINPGSRIGVGFTDINIVGTGVSVTGYGTTIVIDFGNINAASGGANVSISPVPPGISTAAGDLWWDSQNGDLKIYYSDSDSSQWIDANGGSQSLAIISETAPSGYGVTSSGALWWDSGYGVLKVYYDDGDSKQWVDANSGAYINYWTASGTSKISTSNSVGIGTTNPTERLQVDGYISIDNNVSYGTTTATTNSTAIVGIHSTLATSSYRSVEYTIQATQGTNFHTTKILALHDGTTAYHTEYGSIFNNVGVSTYNVDVSGGNIRLLVAPSSASTTNFKVTFNGIKV